MKVALWVCIFMGQFSYAAEPGPLDYYKNEFKPLPYRQWNDTLFSKVVWHKKVSHLVLGDKIGQNRVILLMKNPHPDAFKSMNYPVYYQFNTFQEAMDKFIWVHKFLRKNGVLIVELNGALITSEKIVYPGD